MMPRGDVSGKVTYLHPYKNAMVVENHPAELVCVPKAEGDACETAEDTHDSSCPGDRCAVWPDESRESPAVLLGQASQNRAIGAQC